MVNASTNAAECECECECELRRGVAREICHWTAAVAHPLVAARSAATDTDEDMIVPLDGSPPPGPNRTPRLVLPLNMMAS